MLQFCRNGIKTNLNAMSSKTVAIVGGGPGGLVAAKTLLHSYPKSTFQVKIFEKSDRIGGIWSLKVDSRDGIIPSDLPTNLSQFAVSFSDLAWSSLDVPGPKIHIHPKAWQVNTYLEEYARRYIPSEFIALNTEIMAIEENSDGRWKVKTDHQEELFDLCILASGFYSKAQPIKCDLDGFNPDKDPVKMVHSSKYRGLDDILPHGQNPGKKLLVIGGANSGGEVAAALAFDLSAKQYAPDGGVLDYRVVHVLPNPVYALPLFVPESSTPGAFVPLDVRLYDLSKRPDQPINFKFARHTEDSKKMVHGLLHGMLGNDSYENGFQKPLDESGKQLSVPKAAIQDHWASYVRSGHIQIQMGRVSALHSHGPNKPISASIQSTADPAETTTINDIAGVIYATGYTPEIALRVLPDHIKQTLSYDPDCPRLPILLPEDSLASHPSIPNLGFIGLYEGPYWGVMEMQARQLAARWASLSSIPFTQSHHFPERTNSRLESLLDIRSALKEALPLTPQYLFGDYLAIMEESARDLKLTRNDGPWSIDQGPIISSRYLDSGSNKSEADKIVSSLHALINASKTQGRFVPHATFRGLQGHWKIQRDLKSKKVDYPTGTFTGEAWFHPRRPSASEHARTTIDKNVGIFDQEYLYLENGTLKTDSGLVMPAHKNYAWRFSEDPEKIGVWFVKQDGKSVDNLYHELGFVVDEGRATVDGDGKVTWKAKGDHLCEADMYVTAYTFTFDGVALERFEVVHQVKGPNKDYTSRTLYTR